MRLVVDASVVMKWLVEEEDSEAAERLLESDHELHAPRLMASEVANALWRKARLGEIARREVGTLTAAVAEMPLHWGDDEALAADAARLALALDRPVYDCVYLALAHRIGGQLITADVRFVKALAATEHGGSVTILTEFIAM